MQLSRSHITSILYKIENALKNPPFICNMNLSLEFIMTINDVDYIINFTSNRFFYAVWAKYYRRYLKKMFKRIKNNKEFIQLFEDLNDINKQNSVSYI